MENYKLYEKYFSSDFCSDIISNYTKNFKFEPRPGWNSWTISNEKYKNKLLENVKNLVPGNLINSWINISVYEPGYFLNLHTDSRSEYTVVVNLNDDYTGGRFLVDNQTLHLKTGDVITFNGGEVQHGVETVTGTTRYSLNYWFTTDSKKVEINPINII